MKMNKNLNPNNKNLIQTTTKVTIMPITDKKLWKCKVITRRWKMTTKRKSIKRSEA